MKKGGYGRIINIISTSVKTPLPGLGVSNTIRLAVASWAKTLANELGVFKIPSDLKTAFRISYVGYKDFNYIPNSNKRFDTIYLIIVDDVN